MNFIIASWTLLIVNSNPNCGHVCVTSDPIVSWTISDGKHQFEQWLRANCIMDIVDDEHQFGQLISTNCNLWPMCILVERRMWHEPFNVMGNYPERWRL